MAGRITHRRTQPAFPGIDREGAALLFGCGFSGAQAQRQPLLDHLGQAGVFLCGLGLSLGQPAIGHIHGGSHDCLVKRETREAIRLPFLGVTTSHSTRLQTTAAKSLVIPLAGESGIGENGHGEFHCQGWLFAMPISAMQIYAYAIGLRREKQSLAFVALRFIPHHILRTAIACATSPMLLVIPHSRDLTQQTEPEIYFQNRLGYGRRKRPFCSKQFGNMKFG